MDGEIKIGTILSTDKFDKQIASLEKKMKKAEDKKISLEADITVKTDNLKKQREEVKALERDLKRVQEIASSKYPGTQMMDYRRIATKYGKDTSISYADMSSILKQRIEEATSKEDMLAMKLDEVKDKHYVINQEVEEYKQKIEGIKLQKQAAEVDKLKNSFNNVGNSIQKSIKNVARLALGIFGLRSAYMALRRASSDLASYDEQYATNLEYIRYALTQAVAPILRYIVNLAATLLGYINAITQAWFGINLFSRGSAENFNKMKNKANGISKAVKEIKKQLTGFDEINMLTDQSDTGTSVGAGGVGITPDFDLSAMQFEVPKWLKWIIDHKTLILSILGAIGAALVLWKVGLLNLMGLGISVAIYGVVTAVKALIEFIRNPSWESFKNFLGGLALAITGVAIAMIAFSATNPVGWILLAIGAVVGLVAAIVNLTSKLFKNKAQILDTKTAQEELTKARERAKEATDAYINAVDNAEEAEKKLEEAQRKTGLSGKELYEQVQNGTLDYKDMNEAQREVYKAYINNLYAQEELKKATEELNTAKKEETKASWENQLAIAKETGKYDEFRDAVVKAYQDGQLSAEEARDYIERAMAGMSDASRKTFTEDLPNDISEGLDPERYESKWQKFVRKWNEFWDKLRKKIWLDFEANFSVGGGYGYGGGSGGGRAKGGIFYPSKLPRLAVGGIINQPGRGIPYHGATIGERGAEAVVPLTDSQQMELLGQTIGKYITINANIPVNMNGRVISRELRQVQSEQDFAFNM